MTTASRVALRGVVALALCLVGSASAQDAPAPESGDRPEATLGERIDRLVARLDATRERIAPLIDAVDVTDAEAWLAASPLERLEERASAQPATEAELALWKQAVAHEEAGAERIRGALGRAELALTAGDRIEDVRRRIDAARRSAAPSDADEAEAPERPLSRIEQEIAAANARRAEVALELEQRRAALGRLEEQLRGQAETIERLRREREQAAPAAEPAPDSGAEDPTLADARQAVAAAAERRRDAPLIAARLDARTLPVRVEVLRAEIAGFEVEEAVLAARLARLQAELGARSTAALRELSAELTRLLEREPD